MLSNSSSSLFWPVHSISAPPFICLAGAFHQRAAVYLFGRRIPSAPRRFFVRPAMSRAASSFVCRRIRRRPTDLVLLFGRRISSPRRILFRLAGAFFAADPPIWCYFVWPAHSPLSRHRFGVVPFGRRIPRQAATDLVLFHLAGAFPADLVSSLAGAFAANPPIWCCSIWLAHPLAVPPLPV
jgi:hypothetical protein